MKASRWKAVQQKSLEVRRDRRREHAARVIDQVAQWRAEGMGYRRIAALLNLGGVAAPRGGTWQANQVRRIWRLAASESLQYVLPMEQPLTIAKSEGL